MGKSIGTSHCVLCTCQEDMLYCEGDITGGTEGRARVSHEERMCEMGQERRDGKVRCREDKGRGGRGERNKEVKRGEIRV